MRINKKKQKEKQGKKYRQWAKEDKPKGYADIFKILKIKPESTREELHVRLTIVLNNLKKIKNKEQRKERTFLLNKIKSILRHPSRIDNILKIKFHHDKKKLEEIFEKRWFNEIFEALEKKDRNRLARLLEKRDIICNPSLIEDILKKKSITKKKIREIILGEKKSGQKSKETPIGNIIKVPDKNGDEPVEPNDDIKEDIMGRVSSILFKEMEEGDKRKAEDDQKAKAEEEKREEEYKKRKEAKRVWNFYHGQLVRYESNKKKELERIKVENERRKKINHDKTKEWESQRVKKETELKKEKEDWDKQRKEEIKKLDSKIERQVIKKYNKDLEVWKKKTPWYKKLFWIKQPNIKDYLNNKNSATQLFIAEIKKDEIPKYKKWYKKALEGNKPVGFEGFERDFKPGIKEKHEEKIESLEKGLESLKNEKPKPLKLTPEIYKKKPPVKPGVEEPIEDIEDIEDIKPSKEPPKEKRYYRLDPKNVVVVINHPKKSVKCPNCGEETSVVVCSKDELKKGIDEICGNCKKRIIITSTNVFYEKA